MTDQYLFHLSVNCGCLSITIDSIENELFKGKKCFLISPIFQKLLTAKGHVPVWLGLFHLKMGEAQIVRKCLQPHSCQHSFARPLGCSGGGSSIIFAGFLNTLFVRGSSKSRRFSIFFQTSICTPLGFLGGGA
jgi:hypothetical protein